MSGINISLYAEFPQKMKAFQGKISIGADERKYQNILGLHTLAHHFIVNVSLGYEFFL
jgi:hypothetical protein